MAEMSETSNLHVSAAHLSPAITFLCGQGDVTITWTADSRAAVLDMVRRKMAEGYSFFVLKPVPFLPGIHRRVKLKAVEDLEAASARGVSLKGEDARRWIAAMGGQGEGASVELAQPRVAPGRMQTTGVRAATPEQVLDAQSLAVRPIHGG